MTPCNPVNGYQRRILLPPTAYASTTYWIMLTHPYELKTGVQVTAVFLTFVPEQRTIQKQTKIMAYLAYFKPLMARRTRRHAVSKEFSPRHHHHRAEAPF